ncbi:MAG: RICIN domain-containing protein [Capsulimonadaceae bacterium]|nr:RICIN domain-containing protein [Capsulimonadaceae bacterium]
MTNKAAFLSAPLLTVCVALCAIAAARADALDAPWNGMDLGHPATAGSATLSNGTFTLTGSGTGIAGPSDQFHYVYQATTGDFALVAHATLALNAPDGAVAGLMVRDALAATSHFVAALTTPKTGAILRYRNEWVPDTASDPPSATSAAWLKLTRIGTQVTGYTAQDSNGSPGPWKKIASSKPIAGGMIYAGLVASGGAPGATATASFDHVAVTFGAFPIIDPGLYTLRPFAAQAVLVAPDSPKDGGVARIMPDAKSSAQEWSFAKRGDFYAILLAADTTLALTVQDPKPSDGTRVILQQDKGLDSQLWQVLPAQNDSIALAPKCAPKSGLDDFGGKFTPGSAVDIWTLSLNDAHLLWIAKPVE